MLSNLSLDHPEAAGGRMVQAVRGVTLQRGARFELILLSVTLSSTYLIAPTFWLGDILTFLLRRIPYSSKHSLSPEIIADSELIFILAPSKNNPLKNLKILCLISNNDLLQLVVSLQCF